MTIFILVYRLTNGGAERVASLWARGFAEKGYNVYLVIGDDKSPITYTVPDSVKIRSIASYKPTALVRYVDRIAKLRRLVKQENPDLIIGMLGRTLWAKIASLGRRSMIVQTEHNAFERPDSAPMSLRMKFDKFVLNRIYEKVTLLTQADKDFIGDRLKNTVVLPNPLAFDPIKEDELKIKKNVILAAGRLDAGYTKGFDILIRAFGVTRKGWSLQIAGTGKPEDFKKYKALAKECGVEDRVEFLGFVNDLKPLYQQASIFVLSSRYEGFGMVLIEAMSQGCACVACDFKGRQSEIITNESEGLVCAPDDYMVLAQAIERVITDDELRYKMQRGAIERSKYYSIEKTTQRWEAIIDSMRK